VRGGGGICGGIIEIDEGIGESEIIIVVVHVRGGGGWELGLEKERETNGINRRKKLFLVSISV
jgi:hypothetical protein